MGYNLMGACKQDSNCLSTCTWLPGRSSSVFILISRTMLTPANPVKTSPTISHKHQHEQLQSVAHCQTLASFMQLSFAFPHTTNVKTACGVGSHYKAEQC